MLPDRALEEYLLAVFGPRKQREEKPYTKPTNSSLSKENLLPSGKQSPKHSKPRLSDQSNRLPPVAPSSSFEILDPTPSLKCNSETQSKSSSKPNSGEFVETGTSTPNVGPSSIKQESTIKGETRVELPEDILADTGYRYIELSAEQRHVLQMVLSGERTGKSVLLREIIRQLKKRNMRVAVTASTGIAAINIGGKTLHSFAGVGLGNQHASYLIKKAKNARTKERWLSTEVLIIDE
ncbi:hypothetical protein FRC07_012113, partial [Ceratobasidium sp. 392]